MKLRTLLLMAALSLLVATGLVAALSSTYVDWAKSPVQYLMTKGEAAAWKNIQSDGQAQTLVELFWARRDPTPGTVVNEFKDDFDARVKYADGHFTSARTPGSMTDRGKIFILFGPPTQPVQRSGTGPQSTILTTPTMATSTDSSAQPFSPRQLWVYEAVKSPELKKLNVPRAEFGFVDQYGTEQWSLERSGRTDISDLMQKIVQADIVNPNLTAPPPPPATKAQAAPAAIVPMAAPAAPAAMTAFKTPAYETAVAAFRAAKASPYKNLAVSYGEFVTPAGEFFVPVELYVEKAAGLTADTSDLTFFGVVEDVTGKPVQVFEEPAKLTASQGDFFFDRTLTLAPGKYKGTFGLAQAGKPVTMSTANMDLAPLDKGETGISDLILSNNVYPLSVAQRPTDPFAFGGIKVVPKANSVFRKADDLWYFIELRNPGLDESSKAPKVQIKVDVEGTSDEKKPVRMSAPLSEADVQPLKGVEGHYAIASGIPLGSFKPGSYTIKIKAIDTVKKNTYNLQKDFRILPDAAAANKP